MTAPIGKPVRSPNCAGSICNPSFFNSSASAGICCGIHMPPSPTTPAANAGTARRSERSSARAFMARVSLIQAAMPVARLEAFDREQRADVPRRRIVLGDRDAWLRAHHMRLLAIRVQDRQRLRQEDVECRTFAGIALRADVAVVTGDDLITDGEAEAGAAFLRGEERLEEMRELARVHAAAVVAHGEVREAVRGRNRGEAERAVAAHARGRDLDLSVLRSDRLARVDGEVRQHFRDLLGTGGNAEFFFFDVDGELDAMAEGRRDLAAPAIEKARDVDALELRRRGPREAKDLVGDALAALDRLLNVSDRYREVVAAAPLHELEVRLDAHQHVVELVRDRGGDSSEGAHARRLREPLRHLPR